MEARQVIGAYQGDHGQLALDPRVHLRRPFPPAPLVRAGLVPICTRDLDLVPQRVVGDRLPPPAS